MVKSQIRLVISPSFPAEIHYPQRSRDTVGELHGLGQAGTLNGLVLKCLLIIANQHLINLYQPALLSLAGLLLE